MSALTIGQVAERTGFSPSALRYYEGIGLLVPAARTESGYRVYDDDTVDRLRFIGRAKHLGCSLDEIGDLVALWADDGCGRVQRRLHELVTGKIAAAQLQIRELTALREQLQAAAGQLAGPPSDGPCDAGCACMSSEVSSQHPSDATIACTLDGDSLAARMTVWESLLGDVTARTRTPDGALRASFGAGVDLAELARLVAAEQACCSFFSFAITVDGRGVALEVRVPEGGEAMSAALFGAAAAS